jgi:Flp pilus assembly protein TadD
MDEMDEAQWRGHITDMVRRKLTDAQMKGLLPQDVSEYLDRSPDELINAVSDSLMPPAFKARGSAQQAQGALRPEAVRALMTLAVLQRQNVPEDKEVDGALLLCGRGKSMLKSERYKEAKNFFLRAIEIEEKTRAAWLGLAEAFEHLGEEEKAQLARIRADEL